MGVKERASRRSMQTSKSMRISLLEGEPDAFCTAHPQHTSHVHDDRNRDSEGGHFLHSASTTMGATVAATVTAVVASTPSFSAPGAAGGAPPAVDGVLDPAQPMLK